MTAAPVLSRDERFAELKQIEAQVRSCTACPLYVGTANGVPGVGNYEAVVMFVGEGPGAEEDKQGKPFVGRSGQFLTATIEALGIARKDVFITNIVKHRPPDNRDPEPGEIAACSDYLTRQIALINPRIIVTLGRHSMGRWFPGASITRIHGKVQNIGFGRIALAMFHPAAALRNPEWKIAFEKDMAVLPGLIARAQKANEAAARGEALPAGVPHPGDAGYVSEPVRQSVGASVAGDLVAGDLVAGDSVVGDSVVGDSVVGDSVVGDSVVGDSAVGDSVVGDSAASDESTSLEPANIADDDDDEAPGGSGQLSLFG